MTVEAPQAPPLERRGTTGAFTTGDDWCHQANAAMKVAYCGAPLPADEPYCGQSTFPKVGTCHKCGRPHCPDCVVAFRRTV